MGPVEKALWYIEGHLRSDVALADIAAGACVSRHHLLRAFGAATRLSVMRYVRGRRLSEAAQRLAGGAGDILGVAMEAGYNSHEAFTRAFGEQFGITPTEVRERGSVDRLAPVQPVSLQAAPLEIEAPQFEDSDVMLLAGRLRRGRCIARPVCKLRGGDRARPQRGAVHPRAQRRCGVCAPQGTGRRDA